MCEPERAVHVTQMAKDSFSFTFLWGTKIIFSQGIVAYAPLIFFSSSCSVD